MVGVFESRVRVRATGHGHPTCMHVGILNYASGTGIGNMEFAFFKGGHSECIGPAPLCDPLIHH